MLHYLAEIDTHGALRAHALLGLVRAFSRISMYPSPLSFPSTLERQPAPVELMQPHTMIPPPPCFTVGSTLNSSPTIRRT